MTETDYILMMTAGLLSAPEKETEKALDELETVYVLRESRVAGRVSIGGMTNERDMLSYRDWIAQIRAEGVEKSAVLYYPAVREGLAPHLAAAFAGTVLFVLQVQTHHTLRTWYAAAFSSRRNEISAAKFADFIDLQSGREALWTRVQELVSESNHLNNRTAVTDGQIKDYLRSAEGENVFDFLGENIFQEIQIDRAISGVPLLYPKDWELLFDPPFEGSQLFRRETRKEPVYFYLQAPVGAGELMAIMAAQSFGPSILPGVDAMLKENPPPEFESFSDAADVLARGNDGQLQQLGDLICRVIAAGCEEKEIFPVIPAMLSDKFAPDEKNQLRARQRGHTDQFRLLKPLSAPWRDYRFELVSGWEPGSPPADFREAKQRFLDALNAIQRFAARQELTWFDGNFRLAVLLLSQEMASEGLDADRITGMVRRHGFGNEYDETLNQSISYMLKMAALRWPEEKTSGLLAVSLTDVFGGMGSWNDQYFEEEDMRSVYDSLSADFFEAREVFFAACLTSVAG